ncbi:VOC family protein [Albidovulum sp.]
MSRLALDHLVIAATSLDAGAALVEAALGQPMEPGGRHPQMGTHNRLLALGPGEYLEVIAIDPDAAPPARPRWFRLDRFAGPPRLTNWVLRCDDLAARLAALPVAAGRPTALARGDLRWRMAVPDDGCLPFDDAFPGLIEWPAGRHPADRLADRGCRLERLEIAHPEAARLARLLGLADPRLHFIEGPRALRAHVATPDGTRILQ